jgi:hypothetical protein
MALGGDVRVEGMSFKGLSARSKNTTKNKKDGKANSKKRFGKAIGRRAPAMLLTIIGRKLGYHALPLKKIDTTATKASQYDHVTGECKKKGLSERWHDIRGKPVQRDLYSSFLLMNTDDGLKSVDRERCHATWDKFVEAHDREVARVKESGNTTLRWYVA